MMYVKKANPKAWLLLWLGFLPFSSLAQQYTEPCGTGPAPSHIREFIQNIDYTQAQAEDLQTIYIPVTLHIVRSSNGGGGFLENEANLTICDLNQRMASSGMFFHVPGPVNFIDDDLLYTPNSTTPLFGMISSYNVPRTMNVYYTNLAQISLCGFAFYPNSGPGGFQNNGAVVMSFACSQPNGTTLAHEVGHFFSLPHTFDQTSNNPQAINAERVTRNFNEISPRLSANCNTRGDGFCDTPADFIGTRWSCPTGRIELDVNGDQFIPDASYYMSYSADACMSRFSDQQITAMRATLANTSASRGYLLIPPFPNYLDLPLPPQQLRPTSNDTVVPNNALFSWNRIPGASRYQVKIYLFNFAVLDTITTDTFYVSRARDIRNFREHSWEVRALNGANLCTPFSPRVFFQSIGPQALSLNEVEQDILKLHPNLLSEGDRLIISGLVPGIPFELLIFDLQGRKVFNHRAQAENQQEALQLPWLEHGLYLTQLKQKDRSIAIKLRIH
ncbi:MAG: M43 family zinc metalloprotease [Bacteroidia bacterium]